MTKRRFWGHLGCPRGVLVAFLCILMFSCDSTEVDPPKDNEPVPDPPSLKELADFRIGVAIQSVHTTESQRTAIIERVFDSITAEYEMKMVPISVGHGNYNWTGADKLVSYAQGTGLSVHGHALIWHNTIPSWVQNFGGDDVAFEAAIEAYITTTVDRYKDAVVAWDVVNEAFEDNTGNLRDNVFSQRMGPDYIAKVFQFARSADPDALLFYNDYGTTWDAVKQQAVLALVDDFLSRGIPIDGVGLQSHISYNFPSIDAIVQMMNQIADRGLKVHLSELDVRINPAGDLTFATPERLAQQKETVKSIVLAYSNLPAQSKYAITLWGLRDPDSWLINFWGNPEWPLLFNAGFSPKPAYTGFVEALQEGG